MEQRMTNEEHGGLIQAINAALGQRTPASLRSVSADCVSDEVTLQFIHDGELDATQQAAFAAIEQRVASFLNHCTVRATQLRVDAPGMYVDRLLPVVALAVFDQEE
jgi:hypothetical protein